MARPGAGLVEGCQSPKIAAFDTEKGAIQTLHGKQERMAEMVKVTNHVANKGDLAATQVVKNVPITHEPSDELDLENIQN